MPTPIPTPFDITEVPVVPWSPGAREWIIVGVTVATLLVFARALAMRRAVRSRARVIDLLLTEIHHATEGNTPAHLERLAHLSRRVVEYVSGRELSTLSPSELERAAADEGLEGLATTLHELAELEAGMYEPPSLEHDEKMRENARRLSAAVRSFVSKAKKA